jgi:hypothetical protein
MKTRSFPLLAVVLLLLCPIAGFPRSPVVVAGEPPLTEETIGRLTEFFEWAFDVHLTNDQSEVLRKYAIDTWTQKTSSSREEVTNLVQVQTQLAALPADQRALVRAQYEAPLLDSMRKQPKEPMARWALAVYESSHKALAPGTPPLTRQSSDAFVEALFFMAGEVSGQPVVPDAKVKDGWAKGLAAGYTKMAPELKQQIAAMPLFVTTMRVAWPAMAESEKAKYRAQWAEQLKPMTPPAVAAKTSAGGKKSVAEMMAEQNRRHNAYMSTSNAMMDIYKIRFNAQATLGGNPYRYW